MVTHQPLSVINTLMLINGCDLFPTVKWWEMDSVSSGFCLGVKAMEMREKRCRDSPKTTGKGSLPPTQLLSTYR